MRILLSAYACHPEQGSEAGNGWNWAWHLAALGHDVWVLTGHPHVNVALTPGRAQSLGTLHIINVTVPRAWRLLCRGSFGVYLHYLLWLRHSHIAARRLLRARRFDVAHHVTWGSLVWGSRLWRLGIPFVFGPVGGGQTAPHTLSQYFGRSWRRERLRSVVVRFGMRANPLARATARHALVVLATNSETERLARRLGARSVHLVPDTAVPPALLAAGRPHPIRRDVTILWLARLYPVKGLPLALDALSRIRPEVRWKCLIAGGGPLADEVPGWLRRFGVEDRTRWVGEVPWREIGRMYEQADIFFFTSLRDSSGAQLFEAAAFGLPIVALDHQGVADLIPDDMASKVPVGYPAKTAEGLARAIEALASDPQKHRSASEAALRFAHRNTWAARVDEAYSIIRAALAAEAKT